MAKTVKEIHLGRLQEDITTVQRLVLLMTNDKNKPDADEAQDVLEAMSREVEEL